MSEAPIFESSSIQHNDSLKHFRLLELTSLYWWSARQDASLRRVNWDLQASSSGFDHIRSWVRPMVRPRVRPWVGERVGELRVGSTLPTLMRAAFHGGETCRTAGGMCYGAPSAMLLFIDVVDPSIKRRSYGTSPNLRGWDSDMITTILNQ